MHSPPFLGSASVRPSGPVTAPTMIEHSFSRRIAHPNLKNARTKTNIRLNIFTSHNSRLTGEAIGILLANSMARSVAPRSAIRPFKTRMNVDAKKTRVALNSEQFEYRQFDCSAEAFAASKRHGDVPSPKSNWAGSGVKVRKICCYQPTERRT